MDLSVLLADPAARAILHERARSLARSHQVAETAPRELVLRFTLGNEQYALPATATREVIRCESVAPLPAVHPAILGLVNVRGRLLVCLDLRPLLGLPTPPSQSTMYLLIVSAGGMEVALLVDQVVSIQPEHLTLHPTPAAIAGRSAGWVRGVDDQLALHLDPDGLLGDPRLATSTD
ncbi:chemotaxis protein CheW [Chloroflexus islandicus]|uniref:Chemotaxis protein CheW n=1 Tax=Chloroflexus islandicus TaxID=1707952 RepID=A0A178LW97_9CHLR|nr:chemotaxis protein CheW [Chloroflexus islandicus]OAN37668.1 chemotaxis protein CheW [Chloroflexus islandicus]